MPHEDGALAYFQIDNHRNDKSQTVFDGLGAPQPIYQYPFRLHKVRKGPELHTLYISLDETLGRSFEIHVELIDSFKKIRKNLPSFHGLITPEFYGHDCGEESKSEVDDEADIVMAEDDLELVTQMPINLVRYKIYKPK